MFLNRTLFSISIIASTLSCSLTASIAPIKITQANFKTEILQSNLPVILAYFSLAKDWNSNLPVYKKLAQERSLEQQKAACKMMLPIFLELAKDPDLKEYKFALLDVDAQSDLALNTCQIDVIPSFELFNQGKSCYGFDSLELDSTDKEKIKAIFKKYLTTQS